MRKAYTRTVAAALFVALVGLWGCKDDRTYDRYHDVNVTEWEHNDTMKFAIPRQWGGRYKMSVGVLANHEYPFQQLSLVVRTRIIPSQRTITDTVTIRITDSDGMPLGKPGITSTELLSKVTQFDLKNSDSLYVTINHNMRQESIKGISSVGIRLTKE